MLSTILPREKPTEVGDSTWEVAEGMKTLVHPSEQDQDSPGKQQVQGSSSGSEMLGNLLDFGTPDLPVILISPHFFHLNSLSCFLKC